MDYINDYFSVIEQAIVSMVTTDINQKIIQNDVAFKQIAEMIKKTKSQSGLIFFAGNGASATMAEHMSHDFFQNAEVNTQTCAETGHITAIGNDYGYSEVFSYRIGRILTPNDMLFTISSSGNSDNIIRALEVAREKNSFIVTLSGKQEDNASRKLGDINIYVPLMTYGLVESAHAVILHAILDYYLDHYMKGRH